jgi:PAS domain S-box-containing protein
MVVASNQFLEAADQTLQTRTAHLDPSELLRHVLATMPSGLFTVDTTGRITSWNQAMEDITGYRAGEMMGKPCAILRGDTCFAGPLANCENRCPLFAGERVEGKRCVIVRRDGSPVPVHKNARLMHGPDGEVIGGIEALNDLSGLLDLEREVARLQSEVTGRCGFRKLVGSHPSMQRLYDLIELASRAHSSVLVQGETGTGKELVAHAIHESSERRSGPFVRVSCAALSETLLESELFGHVRGAFTGAVANRAGRFEAADGGTIFLDEIGDISPNVQKKLLRVLQEREFERVGDSRPIRVDIRVIAATHRDLLVLSDQGQFRSDLYYRLAVIPVAIPPLRARTSDIPQLVDHFVSRLNRTSGRAIEGISSAALERLMGHNWPGNVRELEHALEYAFAVCREPVIGEGHLPPTVAPPRPLRVNNAPTTARKGRPDRSSIEIALRSARGNRTRAAEALGVSRVTLWKWMRALDME